VFIGAGVLGLVALTPLYFLVDLTGSPYPPPVDYPHFFYGFVSVAYAWQLAFLVIGSDPARFRPLMIPSMVEKAGYVIGTVALRAQDRISAADAGTAAPDAVLLILFVAAFLATRPPRQA
jgi:cytochrome b